MMTADTATVRADQVEIGDEVCINGVWRRVSSLERPPSSDGVMLGFGRHTWQGAASDELEVRR